jgi:chromosome transmission fidelity protein 4
MKGDLVTMVGRDRFLAVIYHESEPLVDGTQKLGYALYDGVTGAEICSGSLSAISPRSSLNWAGFTNNNCLTIMDESGMLSMLVAMKAQSLPGNNSSFRWAWIPVLDTIGLKKSREDVFWPIHVQDGKLICVPLKGVQYPDAARRPLTSSLQLRMPLARGDGGRR